MDDFSSEITPERFDRLFKEYQICNDYAVRLESYIWQTATLLGVGSALGLASLANSLVNASASGKKISQYYAAIAIIMIAILAVNASLVWWRFARRWWSIQHIKFERMDEIEAEIGFQQNTRIGSRNREAMGHILHMQKSEDHFKKIMSRWRYSVPNANWIPHIESQRVRNYEYRGNQPAGLLLFLTNSVLWLFFSLHIACKAGLFLYALSAFIVVAIIDFLVWRSP